MKNLSMKKTISALLIGGILVFSCKKKDEGPTVNACIDGPSTIDRGQTPAFSWCGTGEEEITWSTSYGESGSGTNFFPQFPTVGKHTVTVTGKNKDKTDSRSIEVTYGEKNRLRCTVNNGCPGNQNANPSTSYMAYLYQSLDNWSNDIKNRSHSLAIDSGYLSKGTGTSFFAELSTTLTSGSVYFSIEKGPYTNWADLLYRLLSKKEETYGGQAVLAGGGELTQTQLGESARDFLQSKWILKKNVYNDVQTPLSNCSLDDHLEFYADGTWKFYPGTDDCGGTSQPSNGTFSSLPFCSGAVNFGMSTVSGPFSGIVSAEANGSLIKVNYMLAGKYGYFEFQKE